MLHSVKGTRGTRLCKLAIQIWIFAECKGICRVSSLLHSAKNLPLPSVQSVDTRQRRKIRRVLFILHSAKKFLKISFLLATCPVFAECRRKNTRQRKSVGFRFFTFLCRVFEFTHGKDLCRVPEVKHSAKNSLPAEEMPCRLRRVLHSAKALPSVFWTFAVCRRHSAN